MKQFDIYSWQPPGWKEPHPVVVVSHPDRVSRKNPVEVLACSTRRATRQVEDHEVFLDAADGLSWPTLCKCDLIYAAEKGELLNRLGEVSSARQVHLVRTILAAHGWAAVM